MSPETTSVTDDCCCDRGEVAGVRAAAAADDLEVERLVEGGDALGQVGDVTGVELFAVVELLVALGGGVGSEAAKARSPAFVRGALEGRA